MPKKTDTAARIRACLSEDAMSSHEISQKLGLRMVVVSGSIARMVDKGSIKNMTPHERPPRWGLSERNDGMELLRHWPDPVLGENLNSYIGETTC